MPTRTAPSKAATTSRPAGRTTRAAAAARTEILDQLKADHKSVKKAYRDFQKLDSDTDSEACEAIVTQVLDELTVHAAVEEELLYPAAREALKDESLIDEAEVEHESLHALIDQLRGLGPDDEKYAARFTVLCEYVLHHVKEEEGEMFPQLETAKLDWESLASEMATRRAELTASAEGESAEGEDADEDDEESVAGSKATAEATDDHPDDARLQPGEGVGRDTAGKRGRG